MYLKKTTETRLKGLKQQPTVEETMERCAKHHVGQGICLLNPILSGYVWLKEPSMLRTKKTPNFVPKTWPSWEYPLVVCYIANENGHRNS